GTGGAMRRGRAEVGRPARHDVEPGAGAPAAPGRRDGAAPAQRPQPRAQGHDPSGARREGNPVVRPRLAAEQRAAAATEGPVRVVAGAGTGKTSVIAERYRRLVAAGVDPPSILVLTFTDRAAAHRGPDRPRRARGWKRSLARLRLAPGRRPPRRGATAVPHSRGRRALDP